MAVANCNATWARVPIEKLYLAFYDGPHATPPPSVDGPIFLGIKNITEDGRLDLSEIRHISEADFGEWTKRVQPQPGDIVFTYEATLNRYAIIPNGFRGCLGRRLALIRPNSEVVDTRFLFYYFFGSDWRAMISQNTIPGSTVDRIPLIHFPKFDVSLPPLPIQRKIAGILSAYDDLIENNTRRIAILEEMARGLYREWFVRFRFPGHEGVRMVESALGAIPEGWEVKNLFDVTDVAYGFPFRSELFTADQAGKPVIRIRDIPSNLSDTYTTEEANTRYIVKNKDILVGMDGLFHMCIWAGGEAYLNQRVARFRPKDDMDVYYLFHALRHPIKLFESTITGTTVSHLGDKHLRTVSIIVPSSSVKNVAVRTFDALLTMEIDLKRTNLNLRQTRDLLLPRLVSGEVDVGRLELELAGVLNEEGSSTALAESR